MALSYNTGVPDVISYYLQVLKVRVTHTALKRQLEKDSFFPSLFSIKNTLDRFRVPNAAFNISHDHWKELQAPFVTYITTEDKGKDFVLVTEIAQDKVTYFAGEPGLVTVPENKFLESWQNIVLVAEPDSESGDPAYQSSLAREKKTSALKKLSAACLLVLLSISIYLFSYSSGGGLFFTGAFILFTKLAGIGLATLLLMHESKRSLKIVKNLCTGGRQINCDAVLNSKAAGIAGFTWSEAGFFYFTATTLYLLSPAFELSGKLFWLAGSALIVSPYILFSIYYQYRVVKQWCPLCLAVQVVLALEAGWAIRTFSTTPVKPHYLLPMLLLILSCILLPVTVWYFVKPLLNASGKLRQYKRAYERLLYNPEQFENLLSQQESAPEGWQSIGITVGNPKATSTILKICNPNCGPCALAHPELEAVVENNPNINLKVIFTTSTAEDDPGLKPVKHLLAIAGKNDQALTKKALDEWYGAPEKKYEVFAKKFPMNGELSQQDAKINAMHEWCKKAGIAGTPTVFINGKRLPENYQISELKHIL